MTVFCTLTTQNAAKLADGSSLNIAVCRQLHATAEQQEQPSLMEWKELLVDSSCSVHHGVEIEVPNNPTRQRTVTAAPLFAAGRAKFPNAQ